MFSLLFVACFWILTRDIIWYKQNMINDHLLLQNTIVKSFMRRLQRNGIASCIFLSIVVLDKRKLKSSAHRD